MSDASKPAFGTICWHDLTIPDAERVRDFYCKVVGWRSEPVDMGGYSDFNIFAQVPTASLAPAAGVTANAPAMPIAGICHARGSNTGIPAQWLVYVAVPDVEESARLCLSLGGRVLHGPRSLGSARFCVVQDPAGAVLGLYQP